MKIIITCEHGGNEVPEPYARLFRKGRKLLKSHCGYDPGALELARRFARRLKAPLVWSTVTRLLVELNRSPGHPKLFSRFTASLDEPIKRAILARHYTPYRQRVEAFVARGLLAGCPVLHLSVHSFTPQLNGQVRNADLGLLYDPARRVERTFCERWQETLAALKPGLRVRRNYPYRGVSDGLVTSLRRHFASPLYAGIELEVNQRWPLDRSQEWPGLQRTLIETFSRAIREFNEYVSRGS
jgi:predicted N-formylglutamate amidohydrolase